LYAESLNKGCIRVKIFPYDLTLSHDASVANRETNDNHTTDALYSMAVVRQKAVFYVTSIL